MRENKHRELSGEMGRSLVRNRAVSLQACSRLGTFPPNRFGAKAEDTRQLSTVGVGWWVESAPSLITPVRSMMFRQPNSHTSNLLFLAFPLPNPPRRPAPGAPATRSQH